MKTEHSTTEHPTLKETLIFISTSAILVLVFFGINCQLELSIDTYATFEKSQWHWMLYSNGRAVIAAVYWLIEQLKLSDTIIYALSWTGAILFLSAAVSIFAKRVNYYCNNLLFSCVISFLTIANLFSIEYFLWIEKALFMFAIFLNVVAFSCLEDFLRKGKKICLLYAFLCLLIAVFTYQISLGLFVVLCLPAIIKHSTTLKSFIRNNIVVASLYGGNMLIALIVTKLILKISRIESASSGIIQTFVDCFKQWINVTISACTLAPKWLFLFIILLLIILCIACITKYEHAKILGITKLLYLIVGVSVVSFFPYLTATSQRIIPRILYPYACLPGLLLLYCVTHHDLLQHKVAYYTACFSIVVLLCCEYLSFNAIFIERYQSNQADKFLCEIIYAEIEKYEQENNIEIKYICFYKDSATSYTFSGIDSTSTTTRTTRAFATSWSDLNSFNYYLDTDYQKGTTNEKYKEYFSQFNWNTYSDDQLIFDGDTLHLCVH